MDFRSSNARNRDKDQVYNSYITISQPIYLTNPTVGQYIGQGNFLRFLLMFGFNLVPLSRGIEASEKNSFLDSQEQ